MSVSPESPRTTDIVGGVQTVTGFIRERALYVWVLFALAPLTAFGHYVAPNERLVKGQDAGILTALGIAAIAAILWGLYSPRIRWSPLTLLFLGLVGAAWLYEILRIQLDGTLFNITALLVPAILVALALKPPSGPDLRVAALVFAYSLLGIAVLTLAMGGLGYLPNGFAVADGGGARYTFLANIGVTRWGGFFGSVNYASAVGGLLVVIGAALTRLHRILIISGGVLFLALGQGRTALIAAAFGVAVLALWSQPVRRFRHPRIFRLVVLVLLVVIAAAYVARFDPTFSGRQPIWSVYGNIALQSPLSGVGNSGVPVALADPAFNPIGVPHDHAHSVLLDGLARWGVVWLALAVAIFVVAGTAALRALTRGEAASLAIVTYVIVAGLIETLHSWAYFTFYLTMLTWAVMVADPKTLSQLPDQAPVQPSVS